VRPLEVGREVDGEVCHRRGDLHGSVVAGDVPRQLNPTDADLLEVDLPLVGAALDVVHPAT